MDTISIDIISIDGYHIHDGYDIYHKSPHFKIVGRFETVDFRSAPNLGS